MNYTNAEKMINTAPRRDFADNLDKLLGRLQISDSLPKLIKVYGESGKSSVTRLVSAVLNAAGYKTGRVTFPIIHNVPNSICVYEKPLTIEAFTKAAEKVHRVTAEISKEVGEAEDGGEFVPGFYELMFATALVAFCDADCDYAVIEIPNDSFSQAYLGNTVISIISATQSIEAARSICARMDRNCREIVSAMQSKEVNKLIFDKCAELNTRLTSPLKSSFLFMSSAIKRSEFTYGGQHYTNGSGAYYQTLNMLVALEATEALRRCGLKIPGTDICSAVLCEGIPLRFEIVSVTPTIIIDRADSKQRREALIETYKMLGDNLSASPTIICEDAADVIYDEFSAGSISPQVLEIKTDGMKKALRPILKGLSEQDTIIVLGSSCYCETVAKTTREILM